MRKRYDELAARVRDITSLGGAAGIVSWDQETMMPPKAIGVRSEQLSVLSGLIHEQFTDKKIGQALRNLWRNRAELTSTQSLCVRLWLRDYEKVTKIPQDLVRELALVESRSHNAWTTARKNDDFKTFAPWLEKLIRLKMRQAEAVGYKKIPYDALLDDYEPFMTAEELDPVIENLRQGLLPIVEAIRTSGRKIDNSFMKKRYPERDQEVVCLEIPSILGLDMACSRLDRSAHPFSLAVAPTDTRITTRYDERWLMQSISSVMHETGHALYEQGLPEKAYGTPLGESVSLGIHESQSRFWENHIGKSPEFCEFILPKLKRAFKTQLRGISLKKFYDGLNKVEATPIRIESDEVTYNMHIVIRYELEKAFVNGDIKVKELPGLWNERMKKYLGITPRNDAEGVLQDTHWPQGLIGYFPTYSLGNLYAAQWFDRMKRDIPSFDKMVAKGDFSKILGWLRENIHRHGRKYTAAELVKRVTGRKLDAKYFLNYLNDKFGKIYGF